MATEKSVVFLDANVLEQAKTRIRYTYENWDDVWLSFSGGKDSLAVLWLMRDVLDDMGLHDTKVKAFFRDEEVIPETVINFVRSFIENPELSDRFDVRYFAVPMKSHLFMLGEPWPYVQWDEGREWMRDKPPYAITKIHESNAPLDQHEMNGRTMHTLGVTGKIAILNGLRADESIMRFRSCTAKKGLYNWVMGSSAKEKNISLCKPIFDWGITDIFKYFSERGITYASIYDVQNYSGESLRVSTPLHDRSYSSLVLLRQTDPQFYEQILTIWPEVATQERYYKHIDRFGIIDSYPKSWAGITAYVQDKIKSDGNRARALQVIAACVKSKAKNKRLGRHLTGGCFGFPLFYVFKQIVAGTYMKGISAEPHPSPTMIEYEKAARGEPHAYQPKGPKHVK